MAKSLMEMLGGNEEQQGPDKGGLGRLGAKPPGMKEESGGTIACPVCGSSLKLEQDKPEGLESGSPIGTPAAAPAPMTPPPR